MKRLPDWRTMNDGWAHLQLASPQTHDERNTDSEGTLRLLICQNIDRVIAPVSVCPLKMMQ